MSVYWKIGIGLADVSLGQKKILAKGVQITEPHQFQVRCRDKTMADKLFYIPNQG